MAECSAPVFAASVQVPRVERLQLVAQLGPPGDCTWTPLLTFQVLPQGQHVVYHDTDLEVPAIDPQQPGASQAVDMFRQLDTNADGLVTRAEMLSAFRRNRQIADILRLPHCVRQHDGTLDRFVEGFLAIDNHKLGTFTFNELCMHLGVKPKENHDSSCSGSEVSEDDHEHHLSPHSGTTSYSLSSPARSRLGTPEAGGRHAPAGEQQQQSAKSRPPG